VGFLDTLVKLTNPGLDPYLKSVCTANAKSVVDAQFTQTPEQLEAAWKVKRLYYVQDFASIYNQLRQMALGVGGAVDKLKRSGISADFGGLNKAVEKFTAQWVGGGAKYLEGYNTAAALGKKAIDAPDFKAWAIQAYKDLLTVAWWVPYTDCRREITFGDIFAVLKGAVRAFLDFIARIVEAVVDAVGAILKIPGTVFRYVKWVLLIGGTVFVGVKIHKYRKARALLAEEARALPAPAEEAP